MGTRLTVMRGALMGASLQYLLDPQLGRTRRARLADQAAASLRRTVRWTGRKARYQGGRLKGFWHERRPSRSSRTMAEATGIHGLSAGEFGPPRTRAPGRLGPGGPQTLSRFHRGKASRNGSMAGRDSPW
jgi:hypothetical protein